MFFVKGFAVGKNVMPSSGFVAAAIMGSNIAANIAEPKHAVSSVERQTSATEKLPKEDWTNAIDSEPIASGELHFPLWIKVP
jgi:6-phosphogluconate dehydrogenase